MERENFKSEMVHGVTVIKSMTLWPACLDSSLYCSPCYPPQEGRKPVIWRSFHEYLCFTSFPGISQLTWPRCPGFLWMLLEPVPRLFLLLLAPEARAQKACGFTRNHFFVLLQLFLSLERFVVKSGVLSSPTFPF